MADEPTAPVADPKAEPTPTPAPEPTPDPKVAAPEPKAPAPEPAPDPKAEPPAGDDWRANLKSDDAKKFAESSPDVDHLVSRALEMRKQLSTAIVPPGKDAKPEEVTAYRKKIGVPESPEGYKFAMPKGQEVTDADKAFQAEMAKAFHGANIPTAAAKQLNEAFNAFAQKAREDMVAADKQFAEESETENRQRWPGKEYDRNIAHGDRAGQWMFGDDYEIARHIETKDGHFLLDHPIIVRAFAAVGREMAEGGLVPPMDASAKEQAMDELKDIRAKIAEAQGQGNSKEANRLFQREQDLIGKMQGNQPIVGAAGRAA